MLIRFVAQNVYSFFESKEFNMLPRPKIRTPEGHKYNVNGVELLKLSAIYGANGAGKSNLVKALSLLQELVKTTISAHKVRAARFKFDQDESTKQILAVEFVQEGIPFFYAVEIINGEISAEELYRSGLGKGIDVLLFERKKLVTGATQLTFSDDFEQDAKSQLLKSILLEEFIDPSKTIFHWLSKRDNPFLKDVKLAYSWFENALQIITPDTKPVALVHRMEMDSVFKKYAEDTMCAYNLGISKLEIERKKVEDTFEAEDTEILLEIRELFSGVKDGDGVSTLRTNRGAEILVVKENDQLFSKQLKVKQSDAAGHEAYFGLDELSDGTIRLLDFLPAFRDVIQKHKVYIIDEIERSMHPSMAKELVKKFSFDANTKGQLIFTTHESNLLDQSIFRQDEIWFAEKRPSGSTDLYSLSDFKEHNTIDIRKGYLNGRYGAVPFLANLHDLNWHA